jgi:hypothetical protein
VQCCVTTVSLVSLLTIPYCLAPLGGEVSLLLTSRYSRLVLLQPTWSTCIKSCNACCCSWRGLCSVLAVAALFGIVQKWGSHKLRVAGHAIAPGVLPASIVLHAPRTQPLSIETPSTPWLAGKCPSWDFDPNTRTVPYCTCRCAGTYRDILAADTTSPCPACPAHVTTSRTGGRSTDDCNLCAVGYGGQACATPCGAANATFGPAGRALNSDCEACPVIKPGYFFDYQGNNKPFAPATVSRAAAESLGDCLSEFAQIEDTAWLLGGTAAMSNTSATTFEACVDGCKVDATCMYLTFDYVSSQCYKKSAVEAPG